MRSTLPRLGLRGAASELAWRLGPVSRLRFHRPVGFLPHRRCERLPPRRLSAPFVRPLQLTLTRHAGDPAVLRLPDDGWLCNSIRHKPCAAHCKIDIFLLENQKPKSHPACACLPPTNFVATGFLRKCDTVNTPRLLSCLRIKHAVTSVSARLDTRPVASG